MIRVAVLLVVLAAGCSSSKPDVWSEYATAQSVVQAEWSRLKEIRELLKDAPGDTDLKAMEENASLRFDVASKHASEIRKRIPGMPPSVELNSR